MLPSKGSRVRTRTAVVGLSLSTALSMALLTACGGEDTGSAGGDKGAAASGKPAASGPAYSGPALPGFAAQAAWSLPDVDFRSVLDLGGTLLLVKGEDGEYLDDGGLDSVPKPSRMLTVYDMDEPQPLTLEFRDAKTGAVGRTIKADGVAVELVSWLDGVPAVAVATTATTESDGLTEEKTTASATLYDARGEKLADVDDYAEGRIRDGYRVETADDTLTLTPLAGGTARTVTCTGSQADCTYDPETGVAAGASGQAPLITGGYYAGFENASNYESDKEQVTLNDLATGEQVWSSADAKPAPGVDVDDEGLPESESVRIVRVEDGRVLLARRTSPLSETWIHAWYDLKGGAPQASYEATENVLYAPDGSLAAEDEGEVDVNYDGTAVWQVADGERLWTQEEGETALDPVVFTADGSVLYGRTDGDHALAVDSRTRKVLAKDLPIGTVPLVDAATGYGFVTTDDGLFALPPA
jgi:hypothetical protein